MKTVFRVILSVILIYTIIMLVIDGGYTFLSLNRNTDVAMLLIEKGIPYLVCLFAVSFSLPSIWKNKSKK